ncbi:MAG: site-2 protease family protein, partial [Nanoarchaeota archaeon]
MNYSKTEIKDLAKAWLVISLAFAIVIAGFNSKLILIFPIMLLTVGVGFLLHELAHKYVAQKFGYKAEFRAFNQMLIFSLITSFFGFVFAAPGGVFHGRIASKQKEGLIAIAGPLVNVVLSLIFLSLYFIFPSLKFLFFYGAYVN